MTGEALTFRPHPLLRGGHVQTIVAAYLPGPRCAYKARQRLVTLAHGDRLVLHDDCPAAWQPGDRVALLIHGLSGCHQSPYMTRIAARLEQAGVRTFRMDLRGCGAGLALARLPYHSGRSEDAAAALLTIAEICPNSPTALVGFSMGGNIGLKLLGELGGRPCGHLDRAVAVCPPIDLAPAVEQLHRPRSRLYERHFIRRLVQSVKERERAIPDLPITDFSRMPRSLWEFDDVFTAPVCGFGNAANYYQQSSAIRVAEKIRVPALVIAAEDDPLVPVAPLAGLRAARSVELRITRHGGHVGYIGWREGGRRWLDEQIVNWIADVA
jgi:predicted alpha/beta-fold hydrolase